MNLDRAIGVNLRIEEPAAPPAGDHKDNKSRTPLLHTTPTDMWAILREVNAYTEEQQDRAIKRLEFRVVTRLKSSAILTYGMKEQAGVDSQTVKHASQFWAAGFIERKRGS